MQLIIIFVTSVDCTAIVCVLVQLGSAIFFAQISSMNAGLT